jgi:S-adenosylmethionine:tRNA ribosyltransferase-isomerase
MGERAPAGNAELPAEEPAAQPAGLALADIDYELPRRAIAQSPIEPRDAARLLVVRENGFEHRRVGDLPLLLEPGDLVCVNDTRVRPARVLCRRSSGSPAELLFLRPAQGEWWEALVRPARKLRSGALVRVGDCDLEIGSDLGPGRRLVRARGMSVAMMLERWGSLPLPPYVRERLAEPERYQTVYASETGSSAAPTAGLHFTKELCARLADAGVGWATVNLEIGTDTFVPIRVADPRQHPVQRERFSVPRETVEAVTAARHKGGRVIAVGTTTVRALESAVGGTQLRPTEGETGLYITPGYRFNAVDLLLTNFHAPRSTLLVLLAAALGERWREAYAVALAEGYRFLSLGDAMLVAMREGVIRS